MANSRQLALRCARICESKKATDIVILDMRKHMNLVDFFVLVSAQNERHARAVVDELTHQMKRAGLKSLGREGYESGRWILQDFGSVVVHLFLQEERAFYDLENLWSEAPKLPFKPRRARRKTQPSS